MRLFQSIVHAAHRARYPTHTLPSGPNPASPILSCQCTATPFQGPSSWPFRCHRKVSPRVGGAVSCAHCTIGQVSVAAQQTFVRGFHKHHLCSCACALSPNQCPQLSSLSNRHRVPIQIDRSINAGMCACSRTNCFALLAAPCNQSRPSVSHNGTRLRWSVAS